MKLLKGTIRPGTVREVLEDGIIKATAPGLFSFEDDTKLLPPIMPWQIGSNCNSFSKPKVYDEIWILNFTDNPRQLYWFRKDNIANNKNLPIADEENVEVVCNRDAAGEWATIYFSDGSGWVISKGESKMQIDSDGSILLTNNMPNRNIHITNSCISLGSKDESAHWAAYGDELENLLYSLCSLLSNVGKKALTNPYTALLGTTIMSALPNITNKIQNIRSPHVSID